MATKEPGDKEGVVPGESSSDSEDDVRVEDEKDTNDGSQLTPEELKKRKEWEKEQMDLKAQLITADSPEVRSWKVGLDPFAELKCVGGVDISFVKGTDTACAMLVVLSYPQLKVLHVAKAMVTMTEPYIPGFLAFREVGFLMDRLNELKRDKPEIVPQVILVDGNGILHPRGFGLASHFGVVSNIPSVGVAKKLFHVDGIVKDDEHRDKVSKILMNKGDHFDLKGKSGKIWGRVLRTSNDAPNPVFISIGHKLSLQTATKLVIACSVKRVPEPTRQADLLSRDELRKPPDRHKKKRS